MDEVELKFCQKCLDDHEERIRELEQNNKLEIRVEVLESYMKGEIAIVGNRKESRSDMYALIGMCISVCTFIVLLWKLS